MIKHNHSTHSSYQQSGVNIDAGNQLVTRIKPLMAHTRRRESLSQLGGFAALTALPQGYRQPVLATTTDGVGTKVRLAIQQEQLATTGIDLVAMCVNDIICSAAEPLAFLDYYATAKLDVAQAHAVITGIAEGCKRAGCTLAGGETAEMPGMYHAGDFDLAGFCLGVAEKDQLFDPATINAQDALIALSSSGPHANGYSLIRWLLQKHQIDLQQQLYGKSLQEHLLQPTHMYVAEVLAALQPFHIKGIAHITGGGITENLPRCLPDHLCGLIDLNSWQLPPIFAWLQQLGNITEQEMLHTFNCGVGMLLVVDQQQKKELIDFLDNANSMIQVWEAGYMVTRQGKNAPGVQFAGTLF